MTWLPCTLADWHGVPEGWIVGLASAAATGIGWLVKHVTTRSTERAAAMQAAASHEADARSNERVLALGSLEKLIGNLQDEVKRQSEKTEKIERDYGERLLRLERRAGRMNNFIVRLLGLYLDIKAYCSLLESVVTQAALPFKFREFPTVELPTFDDDPPPASPAR